MSDLILASASPRRRELLRLFNLPFEVLATDVDETEQAGEGAAQLVARLSRVKAEAAHARFPDALILAADTSVELGGAIFGKPRDAQEARAMLRALRGREHRVYGGITIRDRRGGETLVTETRVWMRDYAESDMEAYIATSDPLDKAAAYGVQHPIFRPVARVEGCFANVMGLALCHLENALARRHALPDPCLLCHLHPGVDCTVAELVAQGTLARPAEIRKA